VGNAELRETRPTGSTSAVPRTNLGMTPACSNEVLPTPDGPYSTVSRLLSHSAATSAASLPRPKKRAPSCGPYERRPT
jgi:hypothetical protein